MTVQGLTYEDERIIVSQISQKQKEIANTGLYCYDTLKDLMKLLDAMNSIIDSEVYFLTTE